MDKILTPQQPDLLHFFDQQNYLRENTFMPNIWKQEISVAILDSVHANSTVSHLGIEFVEVGDDFIRAKVLVDPRTRQPMGILHGGVSVLLAETLGSCGAAYASALETHAVGLDINANHLRSVSGGWVTGITRPVHIGRTTHVWHIELTDDLGRLTCVSRITMAILASRVSGPVHVS